jgi:predicted component of type VI protein secretion system
MLLNKTYLLEFTPRQLQHLQDAILAKRQNVIALKTSMRNNKECEKALDGIINELQELYDIVALKPVYKNDDKREGE